MMIGGAALYEQDLADAMDTFGPIVGQMYGQGESPMTIAVMPPSQLTAEARRQLQLALMRSSVHWGGGPNRSTGVDSRRRGGAGSRPRGCRDGRLLGRPESDRGSDPIWMAQHRRHRVLRPARLSLSHRPLERCHHHRRIERVSAGGVEEALLTHPGVHEVAVVGIPDPAWGESVPAPTSWSSRMPAEGRGIDCALPAATGFIQEAQIRRLR